MQRPLRDRAKASPEMAGQQHRVWNSGIGLKDALVVQRMAVNENAAAALLAFGHTCAARAEAG
ncbi:MAG TPA: hypothetical protein VLR26_13760 [Frankiaceae bacterium]|nr:hypothetical protein [Frankiaceae bacterium]